MDSEIRTYILDAKKFNGLETFYDEIARVFSLPDNFGRNLDALYDMLTDLDGEYEIIWLDSDKSRTDFADDPSQPGLFGQVVMTMRDVHGLTLELK